MSAQDGVTGLGSIPHAYYGREEILTGVVLLPGQELHDTGEHPDNVRRLPGVVESLRASGNWERLFVLYPRYARVEDLARSHDERYVELVRSACVDAPVWLDTDTRVSEGSFDAGALAAGAALAAVDAVAMEAYWQPDSLFALIRPPGHHATPDRAMGFCLFNHASVAARYALATYPFERVAIVDWDVHHGNGTQEIHWKDPSVLYISLHQWPLYPGTGWLDELGAGEGEGYTVNIPMPPGSGDREYGQAFDAVVEPMLRSFAPELLIVSAGQDCHAADTLSDQMVSAAGFRSMAQRLSGVASDLGVGLVVLHEGGYNVSTLPQLDHAILGGLGGFETPTGDPFAEGAPLAEGWSDRLCAVRKRVARYWPEVGQ
ncbi:MAG: histone deacetylase [Propionibacteriaceae bacterium]|nr:histone deacetylase [Propionibacteriaceae bacterium]